MKRFMTVAAAGLLLVTAYVGYLLLTSRGVPNKTDPDPVVPPYDAGAIERQIAKSAVNPDIIVTTQKFVKPTLRVRVKDLAGHAITDATVVLWREDKPSSTKNRVVKKSNSRGAADFEDVVQGKYRVLAISDKHGVGAELVSVTENFQSIDLVLQPGGEIRGRVLAWDDFPLPGAQVVLRGGNARGLETVATISKHYRLLRRIQPGPHGYFCVKGLDSKRYYRVTVRHPNYVMYPPQLMLVKPGTKPVRVYMLPVMGRVVHVEDQGTGTKVALPVVNGGLSFTAHGDRQIKQEISFGYSRMLVGKKTIPRFVRRMHEFPDSEKAILFLCRIPSSSFGNASRVLGILKVKVPGYKAWRDEMPLLPLDQLWDSPFAVKLVGQSGTRPVRFQVRSQDRVAVQRRTISFGVSGKKDGQEFFIGHLTFDAHGLSSMIRLRPGTYYINGNYGIASGNKRYRISIPEGGEEVSIVTIPFKRGGDIAVIPKTAAGFPLRFSYMGLVGMDPQNSLYHSRGMPIGENGLYLYNVTPGRYKVEVEGDGPGVVKSVLRVTAGKETTWMPVIP